MKKVTTPKLSDSRKPAGTSGMRLAATASLLSLLLASGPFAHAANFQSVIQGKSTVTFAYKQMGVVMDGKFRKFDAKVNLDTDKPQNAKGSIDIDVASIDTGSTEADEEVLSKGWFNATAFPKASFTLKALKATGPGQYEATGQLLIKGQTRDLSIPVNLNAQGNLTGSFVIRRGDYAIGDGMWSKYDVVGNEITVKFNLALK